MNTPNYTYYPQPQLKPRLGVPRGAKLPIGMIIAGALLLLCECVAAVGMVLTIVDGSMTIYDINVLMMVLVAIAFIVGGIFGLLGKAKGYIVVLVAMTLSLAVSLVGSILSYITIIRNGVGIESVLVGIVTEVVTGAVSLAFIIIGFMAVLGRLSTKTPLVAFAGISLAFGLVALMFGAASSTMLFDPDRWDMFPLGYKLYTYAKAPAGLLSGLAQLFLALSLRPMLPQQTPPQAWTPPYQQPWQG